LSSDYHGSVKVDMGALRWNASRKGSAEVRYHGVADEGVPVREIAEVIGRRLKLPVVSKSAEETAEHFGFLGHFLSVDIPTLGSRATRK
jgi:hypothetical protein